MSRRWRASARRWASTRRRSRLGATSSEALVLAETKDHLNWELLTKAAEQLTGKGAQTLREACDLIEDQEDEHLYHSRGWCRELWIKSLGMLAVLPPPEETKKAKTAMGAARAAQDAGRQRY